ncbi:hypothetical protein SteCoe_34541 [Stentor coeruleus]|uniref:Translin-associated factor X-interacting protein 1 N-terminal domain-containing protein n=1 Tax=Stentor coeruleus TaxID=5963 RepID=A0A1R2AUC9_9CILI|nr:hypothetical protein SteCoe_34541 [Stentor coeruleus]
MVSLFSSVSIGSKIQSKMKIRKQNSEFNLHVKTDSKDEDFKGTWNKSHLLFSTPSPLKHVKTFNPLGKIINPQFALKKNKASSLSVNVVVVNKGKSHFRQNSDVQKTPDSEKTELYSNIYKHLNENIAQTVDLSARISYCKTAFEQILETVPELKPVLLVIKNEYENFIESQKEINDKQNTKIRHMKILNREVKRELKASMSLNMSWSSRFDELSKKYGKIEQQFVNFSNITFEDFDTNEENWQILIAQNQMLKESLIYEKEKFEFYKQRIHNKNFARSSIGDSNDINRLYIKETLTRKSVDAYKNYSDKTSLDSTFRLEINSRKVKEDIENHSKY